ncbi:hypothetical protein OIO90_005749 [Microbotryomycetes sp. JL221]|nr:hypothetical protein OIO90_005749 [Microbotryomycetes sp. JL221]
MSETTNSDGTLNRRAFYGALVHSKSITEIEYIESALLGIDEHGRIAFIEHEVEPDDVVQRITQRGWNRDCVYILNQGEFLMPGMIDTHTHAPQYVNLAYGQQFELLDWLKHVTFPTEKRFDDPHYAASTYETVVQRLIDCGTTTVCYYGTLHLTTSILATICHRKGQRAFVGKCNMDRESADDYQEASAEVDLIAQRDCGVSHCPNSNFNLRSGATRVGALLDRGIKVGLGTDVSGGCNIGILSAIRSASTASKTIAFQQRDAATQDGTAEQGSFASQHLSVDTLFYLATMGGAKVASVDKLVGDFTVGKEFDALLIQTGAQLSTAFETGVNCVAHNVNSVLAIAAQLATQPSPTHFAGAEYGAGVLVEHNDGLPKIVEKFLFGGDDRNIASVFVRGRAIGGARPLS